MRGWDTDDLEQLKERIWEALGSGADDVDSPFHTPALATSDNGLCRVRTVILRSVQPAERRLSFHTDIRSPKIAQIGKNRFVSWLFYDATQKIQIRAEAEAIIHYGDEAARQVWHLSPLSSRLIYLIGAVPGTAIDEPLSGLPDELLERTPTAEELEAGWQNFALIQTTISLFDWLYLSSRGHRRAEFIWSGEDFSGHWLIP